MKAIFTTAVQQKEGMNATGLQVPAEVVADGDVFMLPLSKAHREGAGVTAVFDALAPSKRKEHVRQVTSAKAEATRQRRINKIVDMLTSKGTADLAVVGISRLSK